MAYCAVSLDHPKPKCFDILLDLPITRPTPQEKDKLRDKATQCLKECEAKHKRRSSSKIKRLRHHGDICQIMSRYHNDESLSCYTNPYPNKKEQDHFKQNIYNFDPRTFVVPEGQKLYQGPQGNPRLLCQTYWNLARTPGTRVFTAESSTNDTRDVLNSLSKSNVGNLDSVCSERALVACNNYWNNYDDLPSGSPKICNPFSDLILQTSLLTSDEADMVKGFCRDFVNNFPTDVPILSLNEKTSATVKTKQETLLKYAKSVWVPQWAHVRNICTNILKSQGEGTTYDETKAFGLCTPGVGGVGLC